MGMMLALELMPEIDGARLNDQLFEMGFIAGFKNNVLRFMPPLTIHENHICLLINATDEILAQ